MSAIDTSKHLRIGLLMGVPIYQLLEDNHSLGHRNQQDGLQLPKHLTGTTIPKGAIVIGGGSGEHPAIAFHHPTHCVARYLGFACRFDHLKDDAELVAACANMQGDLQTLEYCDWTNQNHLDFRERCAGLYNHHREELSFEGWMLMLLGEFLFHVIPAYNPQIQTWHGRYGEGLVRCSFHAVSVPYDTYGGNGTNRLRIVDSPP